MQPADLSWAGRHGNIKKGQVSDKKCPLTYAVVAAFQLMKVTDV
jgi:hypothetical protein